MTLSNTVHTDNPPLPGPHGSVGLETVHDVDVELALDRLDELTERLFLKTPCVQVTRSVACVHGKTSTIEIAVTQQGLEQIKEVTGLDLEGVAAMTEKAAIVEAQMLADRIEGVVYIRVTVNGRMSTHSH